MYLNLFFLFLDGFSINKYEIVENSTIKNIKKAALAMAQNQKISLNQKSMDKGKFDYKDN